MSDVYERLARRLDELPHGFPATKSRVEIKILRKILSEEEAEMALRLRLAPESAEAVAERLGEPLPRIQTVLDTMVRKGQIGSRVDGGVQTYALFPFIVGIWEFQINRLDKEIAEPRGYN